MLDTDGQTFVYPGIFIFYFTGMVTCLVWPENKEYVYSEGGVGDEAGERE